MYHYLCFTSKETGSEEESNLPITRSNRFKYHHLEPHTHILILMLCYTLKSTLSSLPRDKGKSKKQLFILFLSISKKLAQWQRIHLQWKRCGFNSWVRKIPWRREWQPILVFLPGKSHGQRNLVGHSPWGHKKAGHDFVTKQQQEIYTQKKQFQKSPFPPLTHSTLVKRTWRIKWIGIQRDNRMLVLEKEKVKKKKKKKREP